MSLTNLTQIARSKGDPRIERSGRSSLTGADRVARALGWFSVGLGVAEVVAPGRLARALGLYGREGLIRSFGARELASAVATLSVDKPLGVASRIAGDALDVTTLASAVHSDNPKRGNAAFATALVVGITMLDIAVYAGLKRTHRREASAEYDYSNRSGLPRGLQASKALARKDFSTPPDYRAEGRVASALAAVPSQPS